MPQKLNAQEIEECFNDLLEPVLSSQRTAAGLAKALKNFDRKQQDFAIHWVSIIAKSNAEAAYQFAKYVPEAFRNMTLKDVEGWLIHAMDIYDTKGLYPATTAFSNVETHIAEARLASFSVAFEEVAHTLQLYIHGLAGREQKIEAGDITYTDTSTLFLPRRISLFSSRENNFKLYKAITAHLWAQTWYGTFHPDVVEVLQNFNNQEKALKLFSLLEAIRLDARLSADLPGLCRDMQYLLAKQGGIIYPSPWQTVLRKLQKPNADVADSCAAISEIYNHPMPKTPCYLGTIELSRVKAVQQQRISKEKEELNRALAKWMADLDREEENKNNETDSNTPSNLAVRQLPDPVRPGQFLFELELSGQSFAPPGEIQDLLGSIHQDFGMIPLEFLTAARDGDYQKSNISKTGVDEAIAPGEEALLYKEWDFRRQHYRKNWCYLRELDVPPEQGPFVQHTLRKYAGLVMSIRKTFEILRGENKIQKKQFDGENIDFDALVNAQADLLRGMEMPERLFTKIQRVERNIAVVLMVDMSGSTKGWINDAEREALVLLCEALERLGDRYAIYGFSGLSRKRCEIFRVKRFDDPYDEEVRARITGIKPQDYTRMGVTIRHLTELLGKIDARTKLLITLSDGKPDDFDGYRGDYGIEDTRQALIEAKHRGIHPFCVTIDTEARDYLPHMYGAVNYTVINDVSKLPLKIADIYRRLTI